MRYYWILPILSVIISVFFFFFWKRDFVSSFRSQGGLGSKLTEKWINQWKGTGLSGSDSGKAYNNGWINPRDPRILNGKVIIFDNYSQTERNIDPVKISRFELDNFYKLLSDISNNKMLGLDYTDRINKLRYSKLPLWGQRINLLSVWNERKYDLILQSIKKAETIEEVNEQTSNIETLENDYLPSWKKNTSLVKSQNDQLNSFLNEDQRKVFDLAIQGKSIFFTGSAGTGKSFLLQRIIKSLEILNGRESIAVTATTGIAAVNIGGVTYHSFSGIGIHGDTSTSEELVNKISKQRSQTWVNNWKKINTLIIDEISMLDGVIFDKLEYIARQVRGSNRPFGGLQIILTGDFFQLPPVKSKTFCFESQQWKKVLPYTINLTQIYRQKEPKLVNLLNEIRFGKLSNESWEILNNLQQEPNFPNDGIKATLLVSTNDEKDGINKRELNKIVEKSYIFIANDWEDKRYEGRLKALVKNCLAVENLELKIGCQVMLIKNLRDSSGELTLCNGSQGIVKEFRKK